MIEMIFLSVVALVVGLLVGVLWSNKKSEAMNADRNNNDDNQVVIVMDDNDRTLCEISELPTIEDYEMLVESEIPDAKKNEFFNVMQVINPSTTIMDAARNSRTIKCVFTTEIAEKLATGEYHLPVAANNKNAVRLFAKDSSGRIRGHGAVESKVQKTTMGLAVFQVASMVTAQYYLHTITQQLTNIQKGVAEIRAFQENERLTKLQAQWGYINEVLIEMRMGIFSKERRNVVSNEMESVGREATQIQMHLKIDIDSKKSELLNSKKPSIFGGAETSEKDLIRILNEIQHVSKLIRLSLQIKALAALIVGQLSAEHNKSLIVLRECEQQLSELNEAIFSLPKIANERITKLVRCDEIDPGDHVGNVMSKVQTLTASEQKEIFAASQSIMQMNFQLLYKTSQAQRPTEIYCVIDNRGNQKIYSPIEPPGLLQRSMQANSSL